MYSYNKTRYQKMDFSFECFNHECPKYKQIPMKDKRATCYKLVPGTYTTTIMG